MIQEFYPEVKKVKDSSKNLLVQVEKRDINSTAVKKHKECALAVACKREFDGAIIGISKAYLVQGDTAIRFDVTKSAQREIVSFDRSGFFDTGEYQLSKPSAKLGQHSNPGPRTKVAGTPKRYKHVTSGIREYLKK